MCHYNRIFVLYLTPGRFHDKTIMLSQKKTAMGLTVTFMLSSCKQTENVTVLQNVNPYVRLIKWNVTVLQIFNVQLLQLEKKMSFG